MDRRDVLKLIAAATGMALIGDGIAIAQTASSAAKALSFNADEVAVLDEIAETIIPKTQTPGAKDAKVGEFIATFAKDCYTPAQQEILRGALPDIERRSQERAKTSFVQLSPADRKELLIALDKEAKAASTPEKPHYFTLIKQLTLLGFFTSKVGGTEVLVYDEVPGGYETCVPYQKGQPAWSTT